MQTADSAWTSGALKKQKTRSVPGLFSLCMIQPSVEKNRQEGDMRDVAFLRDVLCMIDIALWECYIYVSISTDHNDKGFGSAYRSVQSRFMNCAQAIQKSGVLA